MTNAGVNGYPSATGSPPDGSITPAKLAMSALGKLATGYYYFTHSPLAVTTGTMTTSRLRLVPWYVPNAVTLSRIGAEVTTAGDSGSKVRLGIYADNGSGLPGSLVLDAGTIAGDSNTVQEITVNQALSPGLYWVGGAAQIVTVTQPTVRLINSPTTPYTPVSTSTPTAGQTVAGLFQDSVSGALPAVFTVGGFGTSAIRTFVKV